MDPNCLDDGIDVFVIGANDFSSPFDHPEGMDYTEVESAGEEVFETAQANDVYPGIAGRTQAAMDERAQCGFQCLLFGDGLFIMRSGI